MLKLNVKSLRQARIDWYSGKSFEYSKRDRTPVSIDCHTAADDGIREIWLVDPAGRKSQVNPTTPAKPVWTDGTKLTKIAPKPLAHCLGSRKTRKVTVPKAGDTRRPSKINKIEIK